MHIDLFRGRVLVGGIGIMNIMLANVLERTKEIAGGGQLARGAATSGCNS